MTTIAVFGPPFSGKTTAISLYAENEQVEVFRHSMPHTDPELGSFEYSGVVSVFQDTIKLATFSGGVLHFEAWKQLFQKSDFIVLFQDSREVCRLENDRYAKVCLEPEVKGKIIGGVISKVDLRSSVRPRTEGFSAEFLSIPWFEVTSLRPSTICKMFGEVIRLATQNT